MNEDPKQPLFVAPEERVTIEQLRHRADEISNLALSESKRVANVVYEENVTRAVMIAVGAVLVAASFAYFLGSRAGRRSATPPPSPPGCC